MKLILTFFFILILLISSCGTGNVQNDIELVKLNKKKDLVLAKAKRDKSGREIPPEEVKLKRGQSHTIKVDEPFYLSLIDFDSDNDIFITRFSEDKSEVILMVENKNKYIVTLKEKCQVENISGNVIPQIIFDESFDKSKNIHQVVITPRFDNTKTCNFKGFQIRYGDQKFSGCSAGQILEDFKQCIGKMKKPTKNKNRKIINEDIIIID